MLKFTGTTAEGGNFRLIPEIDDVTVTFVSAEPYKENPNRLKFIFTIDDYDEDDVELEEGEEPFIGLQHWESANIPGNKINPKHRLHFLISGLIGHTLGDDETVDIESFFNQQFKADFKHVPAQTPNGDGSFSIRKDDKGKVVMKAQMSKLKPVKKNRKAAGSSPFPNEEAA